LHVVPTDGLPWLATCAALAAAWVLAVAWQPGRGTGATVVRGITGGTAALAAAWLGYRAAAAAGVDVRWEWLSAGAWPALGAATAIGVIEEGAKLLGLALAVSPPRRGLRRRNVLKTSAAVAAVFAVAEAALALRGVAWPLALSRAALGPVAHVLLAAPFAVALAEAASGPRGRVALRVAAAVALAAALHGFGDYCVAQPGWGRVGFGAALLAPALWLFARDRLRRAGHGGGRLQWIGTAPTP
jgi:RsiW-degrading membrane proteinase PrsW (M82 family)